MPIIKLPRKRLLAMDRESITVDMPDRKVKKKKKVNIETIINAKGIMENKKADLLKYVKEVRDDWA
ncbi:MAG TPA: hypothetical protein PK605_02195 [Ignavibacteria bacterium]|nr:hypothetical protein [Bacteroidota bacterium]HRE10064.1 hypothetical protein [Ignavibacteria bacterium]HRF67153.1 hypothetical protein [Ignavibacteria bacterium]HRJ03192.1 hypothetical protein [Ignavibacteria bacterium]